jgi:hypothetical protein
MTEWTRSDDEAVCLSYRDDGMQVTLALRTALPHLTPGSIRMRLQNVQYLATEGACGLPNAAAQTRAVWAAFSAAE